MQEVALQQVVLLQESANGNISSADISQWVES